MQAKIDFFLNFLKKYFIRKKSRWMIVVLLRNRLTINFCKIVLLLAFCLFI